MAAQKRDNDYFKKKLKSKNRALYDEVVAGRMSVNKARQLAGMGGKRTWLSQLKHAWKCASPADRKKFLSWAGLTVPAAAAAPKPAPSLAVAAATPGSGTAFDGDGHMLDWARRRIPEIMDRRGMSFGLVADELGLNRMNPSVMLAVRRNSRIKEASTAAAIDAWLKTNSSV